MKNFTQAERQKIYEHLLTLQTPDLLASLIAQRADKNFMDYEASKYTSLAEFIANAFLWEESEEDWEFWFEIEEYLDTKEYGTPTVVDVIESTEREMFDSATITPEDDFAPTEITPAKIEINIEKTPFRIPQPQEYLDFVAERDKVSFWTKVKLFLGKWVYKV